MVTTLLAIPGVNGEKITSTGAWKIPTNFQYHMDAGLAEGIAMMVHQEAATSGRNATLLDVGAGKGLYVRYWRAHGIDAQGREGVSNIADITGGVIRQADLTHPFERLADEPELCEGFQWVTCLEVAEHVPRLYQDTLVGSLNCTARRGLILSWPPPGQWGSGHVNLRPRSWVLEKLANFSWVPDMRSTRQLRHKATMGWFKANTLVLRRPEAPAFSFAGAGATDLGKLPALRTAVARLGARLSEEGVKAPEVAQVEAQLSQLD